MQTGYMSSIEKIEIPLHANTCALFLKRNQKITRVKEIRRFIKNL